MLPTVLAGFGLGLSLIVAIGAQNLFVLRQGIRRERVVAVALMCALSDAVLIAVGVSGIGAILHAAPWLIDAVRWAGALFLGGYGLLAARRALRPADAALQVSDEGPRDAVRAPRLAPIVLTCLALTWLNPHVYLDTVFLLGSVANTHGADRWWFAAGAAAASVLWFFSLALGARHLGRRLATPRSWRIVDGVIAVVMIALAVSLVWPR
ncbi:amino acid transporter [Microbacterium hominis]|uniref:LysE/ArgO family amino acid transporter n=1 Tax=Microbacterium hominis TaxID=162426 RepID=UPI0019660C44|nr:LysE/ArgO family amino acid transporter [Microbacterium hominis]QRY40291.1 amino acid transporter [Microbacterium hominis]